MKNNEVQVECMSKEDEDFITEIEYQGNVLRMRLIDARKLLESHGFFVIKGDQTSH